MCRGREARGKMQGIFVEREKGKSFMGVECSFASVRKLSQSHVNWGDGSVSAMAAVQTASPEVQPSSRQAGTEGRRAGCEREAAGHRCRGQRQRAVRTWSWISVSTRSGPRGPLLLSLLYSRSEVSLTSGASISQMMKDQGILQVEAVGSIVLELQVAIF